MTRRFWPMVVGLMAVTVVACTADPGPAPPPPSPTPSADLRPVVDQAPYWCEFIPQEAFRRVSGITQPFTEEKDGPWEDYGGCLIVNNGRVPVSVWWSRADDSAARLKLLRDNWDSTDPTPLPSDLGDGFVAYAGPDSLETRPYFSVARFRCGKEKPWISIDLETVAQGRDPVKDITDLLRVARTRYGRLHDCTPKPL